MLQLLSELRHKVAIGFVGGSNLAKQQEQLATPDINVTSLFDFCFAENGLTAFRLGEELPSQSFIQWIGQEQYNKLVKWYVTNCKCAQLASLLPQAHYDWRTSTDSSSTGSSTTLPTLTSPSSEAPSSSSATA
jgi:hypothetical protein